MQNNDGTVTVIVRLKQAMLSALLYARGFTQFKEQPKVSHSSQFSRSFIFSLQLMFIHKLIASNYTGIMIIYCKLILQIIRNYQIITN